jgi:intein/homing endonuclease
MSVNLLEKQEISKIANTLAENKYVCKFVETLPFFKERRKYLFEYKENAKDFISRAIWNAYIGNVTAFNCQYGKGVRIKYLKLSSEDKFDSLQEGISSLGNLIYNCYTNNGSYFVGKGWLDSLQSIRDRFTVQGWDSK